LPKCPAVSFHKRAAEHIPEALWPALGPILEQIGSLTERIRDYERKLEEISKAHYHETQLGAPLISLGCSRIHYMCQYLACSRRPVSISAGRFRSWSNARFAVGPSAGMALLPDYSLVEPAVRSVRRDMAELVAG
jgi:hypothetical protein